MCRCGCACSTQPAVAACCGPRTRRGASSTRGSTSWLPAAISQEQAAAGSGGLQSLATNQLLAAWPMRLRLPHLALRTWPPAPPGASGAAGGLAVGPRISEHLLHAPPSAKAMALHRMPAPGPSQLGTTPAAPRRAAMPCGRVLTLRPAPAPAPATTPTVQGGSCVAVDRARGAASKAGAWGASLSTSLLEAGRPCDACASCQLPGPCRHSTTVVHISRSCPATSTSHCAADLTRLPLLI